MHKQVMLNKAKVFLEEDEQDLRFANTVYGLYLG